MGVGGGGTVGGPDTVAFVRTIQLHPAKSDERKIGSLNQRKLLTSSLRVSSANPGAHMMPAMAPPEALTRLTHGAASARCAVAAGRQCVSAKAVSLLNGNDPP